MALKFTSDRGEVHSLYVDKWNINRDSREILLKTVDADVVLSVDYRLPVIKFDEDFSSCQIHLFKNRFYSKDDNFFNIVINGARTGVLFPVSIYSNFENLPGASSRNNSDFMYRFLYIAFYHLLHSDIIPSIVIADNLLANRTISISDFYDDETVVFLFHNETKTYPDISKLYPSMLQYGYVPITSTNEFEDIEIIEVDPGNHPLYEKNILDNLHLKLANAEVYCEEFIEQIFTTTLKFKLAPLSKFVILYQVIELLISKIALEEYREKTISAEEISQMIVTTNNYSSFRDIHSGLIEVKTKIEKSVSNIKSEESRINILLNNKCGLKLTDYTNFQNYAQNLIGSNVTCSTLTNYIYNVRNKVMHDYHNLFIQEGNLDFILKRLNIEFEYLIADVLINYQSVSDTAVS